MTGSRVRAHRTCSYWGTVKVVFEIKGAKKGRGGRSPEKLVFVCLGGRLLPYGVAEVNLSVSTRFHVF